jgi:hypothetical protein
MDMNSFNGETRQEFPQKLYTKQPFPVSEYVCHGQTGPVVSNSAREQIGVNKNTYRTPVQTRSPETNIIFGTLGNNGELPADHFARYWYGKNYYGHGVNAWPGRYAVSDDELYAFVREPADMAPDVYYTGLYTSPCSDFPQYGNSPSMLRKRVEKKVYEGKWK